MIIEKAATVAVMRTPEWSDFLARQNQGEDNAATNEGSKPHHSMQKCDTVSSGRSVRS